MFNRDEPLQQVEYVPEKFQSLVSGAFVLARYTPANDGGKEEAWFAGDGPNERVFVKAVLEPNGDYSCSQTTMFLRGNQGINGSQPFTRTLSGLEEHLVEVERIYF